MKFSEVAKVYAQAFIQSLPEGEKEKGFREFAALATSFYKDKEIRAFLTSKVVAPQIKEKELRKIFEGQGVSQSTQEFFCLIARKDRLAFLEDMIAAGQFIFDQTKNILAGEAESATPINSSELKSLEETVGKQLGQSVSLIYKENKNILNGVKVQVGGMCFDTSLNSHLKRIKQNIKKGRLSHGNEYPN